MKYLADTPEGKEAIVWLLTKRKKLLEEIKELDKFLGILRSGYFKELDERT